MINNFTFNLKSLDRKMKVMVDIEDSFYIEKLDNVNSFFEHIAKKIERVLFFRELEDTLLKNKEYQKLKKESDTSYCKTWDEARRHTGGDLIRQKAIYEEELEKLKLKRYK